MAYLVCPHCNQRLSWDFPPGSIFQCARCASHAIVPGQPPPGGGAYGAPYDPFAPGLTHARGREISRSHLLAVSPKLGTVRTLGTIGLLMCLTSPATCGLTSIAGVCCVVGLIIGLQARGEIRSGRYADTPGLNRAIVMNAIGVVAMLLAFGAAFTFFGPLGGTFGSPAQYTPPPPPSATPNAASASAAELEPWYETQDRAYDLQTRVERFERIFGYLPSTLAELDDAYPPVDGEQSVDAWGMPFQYATTIDGYTISSFGADGMPGGDGADTDVVIEWPPLNGAGE